MLVPTSFLQPSCMLTWYRPAGAFGGSRWAPWLQQSPRPCTAERCLHLRAAPGCCRHSCALRAQNGPGSRAVVLAMQAQQLPGGLRCAEHHSLPCTWDRLLGCVSGISAKRASSASGSRRWCSTPLLLPCCRADGREREPATGQLCMTAPPVRPSPPPKPSFL